MSRGPQIYFKYFKNFLGGTVFIPSPPFMHIWRMVFSIVNEFLSDASVQEGRFSRGRWFRPSASPSRRVWLRLHGQEEQDLRKRKHPHPDLGADPDWGFCQHERKSQRSHWLNQVSQFHVTLSNSKLKLGLFKLSQRWPIPGCVLVIIMQLLRKLLTYYCG